ncbi:MAG: NAD(P)/FAD-dependent oxidoreductase [Chloroflexi bacterium]|nr:NAD(P)/FAD-dependent oxidoreductase [Chloroflexota bacterium]
MKVAIVGGGLMGVTLAYHLARAGHSINVYERSPNIGGLATYLDYHGVRVDRFYHTILSSDMTMQTLIRETGVEDRLRFTETKQGFYDSGNLYPFNTPKDFMMFPPLNLFQRFRLALQVIFAQFERDAAKMDTIPVEQWLSRVSGRGVVEKVWRPLLRAKFDAEAVDVPATYIWSRLRRMMSTRQGVTSKEMMCYLIGGYFTLIEALAKHCADMGVTLSTSTPVEQVNMENGRAVGVRVGGEDVAADIVIATVPSPYIAELIPGGPQDYRALLAKQQYLGVMCPLMILNKPLTPYYVLNITDPRIPFTAVVETTNLIAPEHVGGNHLIYLPKYLSPNSEIATWSDERVRDEWMRYFKQMFPDFDESSVVEFLVQRARYVEPLRPMGTTNEIPQIQSPIPGLFVANTVMLYPDLSNGEAVTSLAKRVITAVLGQGGTSAS